MKEIIVSGTGIISALGNNEEENLRALLENRSGISKLQYLQTSHIDFPVGEVKMTDEEMIEILQISKNNPTTRTSLLGMLAVSEALQNAHITPFTSHRSPPIIALVSGTTVGGMDKSEQFYIDFLENETKNAYISTHDCGACTEMIADHFGIFSQVDTLSTACSSAANAIILGAELLQSGRAEVVVAGGSECLTKFHLNGFNTLMILDKNPCRPFDATRAGINLGEGAAYLVMETTESFNKRMRHHPTLKALCKLSGYANTCDAYHQTASSPEGGGSFLAMKQALKMANLAPEQIDYINAHGTGTENNDLSEGTAIVRVFGETIPPVSSTKSFTGHTTSAAGSVEAVFSILALQNNFIPSNLNFSKKMPELPFAPFFNLRPSDTRNGTQGDHTSQISNHKSQIEIKHVLTNSFGFGGNDSCLIFSKL